MSAPPPLFLAGSDPLLGRLRRLALPAVVGAVVGLLVGLVVHQLSPPTWTAQVSVELTALRDQTDLAPSGIRGRLVSVDTDAQLVRSDAVVLPVAVLQQRPVATVRKSISVSARPLSRILLLSYTARSQEAAEEGAVLAASGFLAERERVYVDPQREFFDAVHRATQIVDTQFDLVQASGTAPSRENLRRRAFLQDLGVVGAGRIVAGPGVTSEADRGDAEVPLTSGAAGGALLALLVVAVVDVRRRGWLVADTSPGRARRHRWARPAGPRRAHAARVAAGTIVLVAVTTGGAATAAVVLLQQDHIGYARVYLPPERGNAFASRAAVQQQRLDLGTEAELARSDEVLRAVAEDSRVGLSVAALRSRTRAAPAARGEVVEVAVRAGTASAAQDAAVVVGEQLVAARERRAERWNETIGQAVEAEAAAADADLTTALGPGGSRELINALNRRLTLVRTDSRTVFGASVDGGEVISSRVQRRETDVLQAYAVTAVGALAGLALAAASRGGTRWPLLGAGRLTGDRLARRSLAHRWT